MNQQHKTDEARNKIVTDTEAFLANGGKIDVLTKEWENNPKARIGFNSYSGHMEA